jgi:hypothetical protein
MLGDIIAILFQANWQKKLKELRRDVVYEAIGNQSEEYLKRGGLTKLYHLEVLYHSLNVNERAETR